MSYCKFQNTVKDLLDCADSMYDELNGAEEVARKKLIETCVIIALEQGDVVGMPVEEVLVD